MDDSYNTCGFLYNITTQQILLLQSEKNSDLASSWSMIGGEGKKGEDPQVTFQKTVQKLLDIKLDLDQIYPIYDYPDKKTQMINYIYYVEVDKAPKLSLINEKNLTWVTFGETMKLLFTSNTKQDMVVGERVIGLKLRLDQEELQNKSQE